MSETKIIPTWRVNARAGIPLAQAARSAAAAPLPSPTLNSQPSTPLPPGLSTIIRPGARDRWVGATARQYDPQRIEQVLRGVSSGNLVAQWELLNLMEDTAPRIKKNLNQRKRAVMSYLRHFEPWSEDETPATPEAEHRAKVVANALWRMKPQADENQNGFDDTIYDLLDAVGKGTVLLEVDWEVRKSGTLGLITAPQCTRWIHPRYYGYANQGDWLGLNVTEVSQSNVQSRESSASSNPRPSALDLRAVDGTYARIPPNKFLIGTYKSKSGHPSEAALLRSLAVWWAAANFSQQWFINFAQIFGLPIRWANYDPNTPGLLEQVLDMLENMGSAAYGAFPAGTTLELKEAMKSGTDNPQISLLDRADKNYDLLILGQSGTSEVSGPGKSGGSLAANQVLEGVEQRIVEADADYVMRLFNEQLIPMIEVLNFGDNEQTPELILEPELVEDLTGLVTNYKLGTEAGVITPNQEDEIHLRKKLALPAMSKAVEADWQSTAGVRSKPAPLPGFGFGAPGGNPALDARRSPLDPMAFSARAAADATDKLVERALENLTSVESKWLGGVKPFFHRLIALAQSGNVSDAEFVNALAKAQKEMPGLFDKLQPEHLAEALNDAMNSAVVNGAVRGAQQRKVAA